MIKKNAPQIFAPVCGVFAVFLAEPEKDFEEVFSLSKDTLKRTGKWKGRMYWSELQRLLKAVSVRFSVVSEVYYENLTVKDAASDSLFNDGRQYILGVAGHFLTIQSGVCYDQGNPNGKKVDEYRYRRSKIKSALVIL